MTSRRLVGFALCLVFAAAAHGAADATSPTFYEHVLPILQENCQECHRPSGGKIYRGGVPMSLTTYEEARPWARAIVRMTASKEMPPWDASGSPPHLWPEGYWLRRAQGAAPSCTFDLRIRHVGSTTPPRRRNGWDQSSIALEFATLPFEHRSTSSRMSMLMELRDLPPVTTTGTTSPSAPWCSEASRPTRC